MGEKNSIYNSYTTESAFHSNGHPREYKKPQLVKAYTNDEFLNSGDARVIRILAEYLEVESRLKHFEIKDTVVFYGSARVLSQVEAEEKLQEVRGRVALANGPSEELLQELQEAERGLKFSRYYEDARSLAYQLAKWSKDLKEDRRFIVCSGGGPGIMEAANRGAAEAGAPTIGMNISLPFEQAPNPYISENLSFEFHYFFIRKFWFVYLAKALVVFPGGFGTFDELFELLTLRQTLKVTKPLHVIIYGKEFWQQVVNFDKLVEWGVISSKDLELFHIVDEVGEAFITLRNHFEREFVGKAKYWHW
ncbi:TIGR00730 family Rossman fold protein [candidate division KSB1 bacterium]|nr:TIGR00730 family Rossman fold protein [candidate division KSB1 bacterium]RQW11393.1 MAG: TIGR00730 family Rossman fold protein [candidate division KSB1 bacterium]